VRGLQFGFNSISLTRNDNFFPYCSSLFSSEKLATSGISDGFKVAECSLVDDALNERILGSYLKYKRRSFNKSGFFRLQNQVVFDNWGIVYSEFEGGIVNGTNGFGWPQDAYKFLRSKGYLKANASSNIEFLDYPGLKTDILKGSSALLTFPGALTYGHWIVDIWGRVEILKRSGEFHRIDHFIFPAPLSGWMKKFIVFFEIDSDRVRCVDKINGYLCEELIVPTVPSQSSGGVLPYDLAVSQFRPRSSFLSDWFPSSKVKKARPLFLKHRHLTSSKSRSLANADEIAQVVKKHGGRVIDPTNTLGHL
jgi:hypothetical protein